MNTGIEHIIQGFSIDELRAIKILATEIEKQKLHETKSSISLNSFSLEYIRYIENNFSPSYRNSIKLSFTHLFSFFLENKLLKELSVKNAEDFKSYIMKGAPLGYKIYIRNLKAAFNKAVDWEMISSNPFAKIKISKHQQVKPKFMKSDELNSLLAKTKSTIISELFLFCFLYWL